MFYKHSVIIEELPAWEECTKCDGYGAIDAPQIGRNRQCPSCKGEGGKYHEAVGFFKIYDPRVDKALRIAIDRIPVRKISTLVREHKICIECKGSRRKGWRPLEYDGPSPIPCDHCLKDVDGNPMGAEPGTATRWQVKEDEG